MRTEVKAQNIICQCGRVELSQRQALRYLDEGTPYIVNRRSVYELRWCHGMQAVYGHLVHTHDTFLTQPHSYDMLTAKQANERIGYKLFYEQ